MKCVLLQSRATCVIDLLSSIASALSCARIISDDRVNNSRGQIVPDNPSCRVKDFDELHKVRGRIVQFDRWRIATDRTWLRFVGRACHVDASSASGRIASTCLQHGIVDALSAIPVTNPSFSPSGEISRFRLTHTILITHTRTHARTHTRNIRAANVALRRLLFHESRLHAIVRSSLRCITTECCKFAVGFAEIELSFALETRMVSVEGRKRISLPFDRIFGFRCCWKNAAVCSTAIAIFILYTWLTCIKRWDFLKILLS